MFPGCSTETQRMVLPDVGKSSFFYTVVYKTVSLYYRLYYRSFTVIGRENVPKDKPVIFAGNHQNALMDALSILFASGGKVVFLARADLFRNKFLARILFFFRILPVYRMRDGISSMGENTASFKMAAEMLKSGAPLALFPEGNHDGFKRLRSLKKGICRIAFLAEESSDFTLDLQIVPSGIDYSNYADPGARLLVKYGKPIPVADFIPLYKENPQKALSALRDKLSEGLAPLMINISTQEHYDQYMTICQLYRQELLKKKQLSNTHPNRLIVDQEIISDLDRVLPVQSSAFDYFGSESEMYQALLKKFGLRDWLLQKNASGMGKVLLNSLLLLILFPIYLYGLALNYIPYKLPSYLTRKVKDHVFLSSLHFGIGLLLFPIYYLLIWVIFCIFTKGLLIKFLFALSLPFSGIFTFHYYLLLLKLRGRFRLLKLRLTDSTSYNALIGTRKRLIQMIEQIIPSH
jgi:1-acyl-sn-glycerol-3-phosphate acyltransferase